MHLPKLSFFRRATTSPDVLMWASLTVVLGLWVFFFWILDLLQ